MTPFIPVCGQLSYDALCGLKFLFKEPDFIRLHMHQGNTTGEKIDTPEVVGTQDLVPSSQVKSSVLTPGLLSHTKGWRKMQSGHLKLGQVDQ